MGGKDKRSSPRQIVDVGDQIILHHTSNGARPAMNGGGGYHNGHHTNGHHHHNPNGNGVHHPSNGVQYLHPNYNNGSHNNVHNNSSNNSSSNGHQQQQQQQQPRRSSISRSSRHRNSQCPSSASSSSPTLPTSGHHQQQSGHRDIDVEVATTPICRCRVMYLGSSVPHATKDGLQGIQEPLKDLYPEDGLIKSSILNGATSGHHLFPPMNGHGHQHPMAPMYHPNNHHHQVVPSSASSTIAHHHHNGQHFLPNGPPPPLPPTMPPNFNGHHPTLIPPPLNGHANNGHQMIGDQQLISLQSSESIGIDSWLSVWSNGILIENVDDSGSEIKKFFPIESLHYCAAVRFVTVPSLSSERVCKFLPLDSPFSRHTDTNVHPPLFACILRRTTGIKVLECHAFICKREAAANALVRSCFHAYADSVHAKQMNIDIDNSLNSINGSINYRSSDRRSSSSVERSSNGHGHNGKYINGNVGNGIKNGGGKSRRSSSQSRDNQQQQQQFINHHHQQTLAVQCHADDEQEEGDDNDHNHQRLRNHNHHQHNLENGDEIKPI